jgi:hypothetical protein
MRSWTITVALRLIVRVDSPRLAVRSISLSQSPPTVTVGSVKEGSALRQIELVSQYLHPKISSPKQTLTYC